MKFSLIVCTYMRPQALQNLLNSVKLQSRYPDEILIVDGSTNNETELKLNQYSFKNLRYYKVDDQQRGLTKQRNFGISKVATNIDVVCFLDDDIVLTANYFDHLIGTYIMYPKALGVGGYIINDVNWETDDELNNKNKFYYDGFMRDEPFRFKVRGYFGLLPETKPCYISNFSHGRSVSFLPPSGKTYPVEQFMGGVASYKRNVFSDLNFSEYFQGYGLYEDVDFTYRLSQLGALYVNTNATLYHYHDNSGRPNNYEYGKMVLRNGWYVWRLKNGEPKVIYRFKWHATSLLLILIRFGNIFNSKKKYSAYTEVLGRTVGWFSLFWKEPVIETNMNTSHNVQKS